MVNAIGRVDEISTPRAHAQFRLFHHKLGHARAGRTKMNLIHPAFIYRVRTAAGARSRPEPARA